jgi:hypothetical protein
MGISVIAAAKIKEDATQLKLRAFMDNSLAMAGRATLMAEPIKGVRKELSVVTRRTDNCFLLYELFIS